MNQKFFCLHSHFYQPPRENPWLNIIEAQKSAHPYHDWNERITAECYYPNAFSKIYDDRRVMKVMNNYAYMNFNFGPTLLSWLEVHSPSVYSRIIEADAESLKLFDRHGGAIAQVYNHIIMPLAKTRDKIIQIEWGIKDFEHRFKRKPQGMWLAETGVDSETLTILADYGIKYTILSPYQALSVFEHNEWINKQGGLIDYTLPYKLHLKNNKEITIIFYEGHLSKAVAFDNLLVDGNHFMNVIESKFKKDCPHKQLVTLAADGETYGHHKKFGELGISYIFDTLEKTKNIKVCNISYFLAHTKDYREVKIVENTAWSCAHNVGRWKEDCGCKIDTQRNWHQKWRSPLRAALDNLKSQLDDLYYSEIIKYIDDKNAANILLRNYIKLMVKPDVKEKAIQKFIAKYTTNQDCIDRILLLLEMQKYSQYMFTSCGWFFDDISGLEATQILKYAYYAISLTETFGVKLEDKFIEDLKKAPSNDKEFKDGAEVYHKYVKPARFGKKIIAAIASAHNLYKLETSKKFELFGFSIKIISINFKKENHKIEYAVELKSKLDCRIFYYFVSISEDTRFSEKYSVSALDANIETIRELAKTDNFKFSAEYSFLDFPQDTRIRILKKYVVRNLSKHQKFFEKFYSEIDYYKNDIDNPGIYLPPVVKSIMQEVIYTRLKACINKNDVDKLSELIEPAVVWNVRYTDNTIHQQADKNLIAMLTEFLNSFTFDFYNETLYGKFLKSLDAYRSIELNTNLPELQAAFYEFHIKFSEQPEKYKNSARAVIENLNKHLMFK